MKAHPNRPASPFLSIKKHAPWLPLMVSEGRLEACTQLQIKSLLPEPSVETDDRLDPQRESALQLRARLLAMIVANEKSRQNPTANTDLLK